jgi:hypothetical protein
MKAISRLYKSDILLFLITFVNIDNISKIYLFNELRMIK